MNKIGITNEAMTFFIKLIADFVNILSRLNQHCHDVLIGRIIFLLSFICKNGCGRGFANCSGALEKLPTYQENKKKLWQQINQNIIGTNWDFHQLLATSSEARTDLLSWKLKDSQFVFIHKIILSISELSSVCSTKRGDCTN